MKKTTTITSLLGLSQDYMAMLLKVTRTQWSMYELGKRDIPLESKRLLAEMIGFLKMGETEAKTLPHLDHQQEAAREQLEKSLKDNHHQLYEITQKIATAQERYIRNTKAVQLSAYLSSRPETQKLFDGELLKNISDRATTALQKSGLSELTSLKMKAEVLQLEKLVLGSALRKMTLNPQPIKV
jgi:transcriptional regulator with XRE-family HTH domain